MSLIRTPRQDRLLPRFLTVGEADRLLAGPDDSTLLGARDRAVLETMYSTGVRVSGLAAIRVGDVDFAAGLLRVAGKGGAEQVLPVGRAALDALGRLLSLRDIDPQDGRLAGEALFVKR